QSSQFGYQAALQNFNQARQQAMLQEVLARLTGKSNKLLSYEEVAHKLKLTERAERGVQAIPLEAIVGSVGRYTDFTRTFLPRQKNDRERWARVSAVFEEGLPAIDVYKVGEVYFVLDGNHRVSIARQNGKTHIDAHVIEVRTRVPLTPDVRPDDLIVKAEYAGFLDQTQLDKLRPAADLSLTAPGQYEKLKEQIDCQRYCMQEDQSRTLSYPEAVEAWHDEVYLPIVTAIRERGLLRWFPGRTETDLYLWVAQHRQDLEQELGWAVRPEAAVTDLAVKESTRAENEEKSPGSWRKARLIERYAEQLFMDILVPLNGSPASWQALDQAIIVAQHEAARLQGLHIVASEAQKQTPETQAIQVQFNQQCEAAKVAGSLVIEIGDVTRKICERALLTDLVVLNVAHPPATGLHSLGSGLRTIIWRCARPILAIPDQVARFDRALLAYDGSPKAKEALFVATYLAERWKTALTVLTLPDARISPSVQDYARAYLEMHEIQAEFVIEYGMLDKILKTLEERRSDLLVMGGYSISALEEVVMGSAVNVMLRQAHCPLLICR
ncbi:MAG TPA: universal stress protein, partial [Anaerolineae bacterium]